MPRPRTKLRPPAPQPAPVGLVIAIERRPDGPTVLRTTGSGSAAIEVVECRPDLPSTRRRLRSVRRIDRVELILGAAGHTARVRGMRHRLPFSSCVPLATALGLTDLGIRTTIARCP